MAKKTTEYSQLRAQGDDINFIMEHVYEEGEIKSVAVVGFYYGDMDKTVPKEYIGKPRFDYS